MEIQSAAKLPTFHFRRSLVTGARSSLYRWLYSRSGNTAGSMSGAIGLEERSRAPQHTPHKTRPEIVDLVLKEKRAHPTWGPRKLKVVLEQRLGHAMPAASTLGEILGRALQQCARKGPIASIRFPWVTSLDPTCRFARRSTSYWTAREVVPVG